jgi:hypothetical protein
LKRPGQTVYALSWTSQQPSTFWALWRAQGQAVREDTECRITRARNAVATIRQAGPQLPSLGTRLFAFAHRKSSFYPEEGWALIWQTSDEVKAARAKSSTAR